MYNEYREIYNADIQNKTIKVKGLVTDADTGNGLKGVQIQFKLNNKLVLDKVTADGGGFLINTLDDGEYTVIFIKLGYKKQMKTVQVSNTDQLKVIVSLIRLNSN